MVQDGRKAVDEVKTRTDWRPVVVPALALIVIGVLPGLIKGLYEPYTTNLMAAYVLFGMLFMGAVVAGLAFMVSRDITSRSMKVFRLAPEAQCISETECTVRNESAKKHIGRR